MEDELFQKYKTVFYFFDCYSQFDKNKNCFNDIYELDGIKWNLGEMWESYRLGTIIPYEGEIPKELVDNLNEEIDFIFGYPSVSVNKDDDEITKAYTDFKSFIKFIVANHNYRNGTDIKYEDVYNYFLDKYYQYNCMSRDMTITDLSKAANNYYIEHFNLNVDEMDLAINGMLQSIDEHHSNTDYDKLRDYGFYEYDENKDTYTNYCEYRLDPAMLDYYSIKREYLVAQERMMDEVKDICNQFSLSPKDSKYALEVSHECLASFGSVYDKEDYDENTPNSLVIALNSVEPIDEEARDDTQFILYNLSTHEVRTRYLDSDYEIDRVATVEDKKVIYNFLCKLKEIIDIDLKEKDTQKVLTKKK